MVIAPRVGVGPRGVRVRALVGGDVRALHRAITESVEHLRPWMPWIDDEPQSLEQRGAFIDGARRRWSAGGDLTAGIFVVGTLVGCCGLHRRIGPHGLEIGYWIHPASTRRGYATDAARLLTTAAFGDPSIECVEIRHDRANGASGAVAGRLGFQLAAASSREIRAPGEVGVEWQWRMDRRDWVERHPPAPTDQAE
jgi:ribosomal-protein-serine acetyltransferase